jgi:DNA-directed RNA polymerase specialized sigma24 family protein
LFKENSSITPLISRCQKNDQNGQKQLFFLYHEFALRICYRYAGIHEDPAIFMYEAFFRLFKSILQLGRNVWLHDEHSFKNWFKEIVIDSCIKFGEPNGGQIRDSMFNSSVQYSELNKKERIDLSAKDIIDILRSLSFGYRAVFNLFVIDGFSYHDISMKLKIPVDAVKFDLMKAREGLQKLLHPIVVAEPVCKRCSRVE